MQRPPRPYLHIRPPAPGSPQVGPPVRLTALTARLPMPLHSSIRPQQPVLSPQPHLVAQLIAAPQPGIVRLLRNPTPALARPASASVAARPTSSAAIARPTSLAPARSSSSPLPLLFRPSILSRGSPTSSSRAVGPSSIVSALAAAATSSSSSPTPSPSTSSSPATTITSSQINNMVEQRRAAKRVGGPVCNGNGTWEQKSNDFSCPICFEVLHEAHITKCGHTYCYQCINSSIDAKPNCPICGALVMKDQLAPNFLLTHLIGKQQRSIKKVKTEFLEAGQLVTQDMDVCKFFSAKSNELGLSDINLLLTMLRRRKEVLTIQSKEHQRQLLLEFLSQLHKLKQSEKCKLNIEVSLLENDIKAVVETASFEDNAKSESSSVPEAENVLANSDPHGFNTSVPKNDNLSSSMAAKKVRIHSHFDELVSIYMDTRNSILYANPDHNDSLVPNGTDDFYKPSESLNDFANTLTRVSRYHGLKPLATFSYSADLLSNSNIVSSIEFDKDNEFFAIAGVTRKIKLFEYATVVGSNVDIHCPSAELACAAKISCIGWSNYYKNSLASSDYDGCVSLWDSALAVKTRTMSEHEKRVWSVDWSNGDPRLFASGSDDTKVKLWSTGQERSVATLDSKANVCCVKFCPENTFHIAFGSADHCVHYYDFRNPRQPLGILVGHKKAVSYVKFASKNELVSASTDSNLKLWDLTTMDPVRSFQGHINEKNFVGLATDGDYVACGSENNSLYVYYKKLPKPLFSFKFDNHRSMLHRPMQDDTAEFVSAVAWKKGAPVVVAANSQGAIKVLEME